MVIPSRNDAGNIAAGIERLPHLGATTEVIFVEGHSSDNIWQTIEQVCASYTVPSG